MPAPSTPPCSWGSKMRPTTAPARIGEATPSADNDASPAAAPGQTAVTGVSALAAAPNAAPNRVSMP
eukprot:2500504-Prymnesium_polylepis.1